MINLAKLDLIPAARLWVDGSLIPASPGVYGIFFDSAQLLLERSGYLEFDSAFPLNRDGFDLLYVGATASDLRIRALQHLVGDSRSSSLRMTVGALLAEELALDPVGDGSRTYFSFGDGERRLSEWLAANTRLAFWECDTPFVLEKHLLRTYPVPFNISDRKRHPFSKYLMSIRAFYAGRPRSVPPLARPSAAKLSDYRKTA